MSDVAAEIARGNEWYVGDQFAWARRPDIARIYNGRRALFERSIETARTGRRHLLCLDAGCGDGYWLERLQGLPGVEWCGFDYNPVRVERARRAAPRAKIVQSDLFGYQPDRSFDVVLVNQVIEHIPDDLAALRRVGAWLRPGGILILGTTNEGNRLQAWRRRRQRTKTVTDHVHFYTEQEVGGKIADSGWKVLSVYREAACLGIDRIDNYLMARGWGFRMLTCLVRLWPASCSDFYFVCERREEAGQASQG